MKNNLLVTLADKNYIDQAKQLFSSSYWNGGWKGDFLLLAYKIPESKLKIFRDKGIKIYKCDDLKFKNYKKNTIIKLCKLKLFNLYFKRWNNIVFLDSDIIVNSSLIDFEKFNGFNAVEDNPINNKLMDQMHKEIIYNDHKRNIDFYKNYDITSKAFNSGVFIFNTSIINKDSENILFNLYDIYGDIFPEFLADQVALNLYFYKKWNRLPFNYNFHRFDYNINNISNKYIVISHLAGGSDKPWKTKSQFNKYWTYNLNNYKNIDIYCFVKPKYYWNYKIILNKEKKLLFLFYLKPYNLYMILLRIIGLISYYIKRNRNIIKNYEK